MDTTQLKDRFFTLVAPDLPNEWDVEEAMENLEALSPEEIHAVFSQVSVIWPISHSLCFSYLTQVASALGCIEADLLPQWVNETLDYYERSGLREAQRYMMDVQGHFVCRLQGKNGLRFSQVAGRLLPYAKGLGCGISDLKEAEIAGTDSQTIYLPGELSIFPTEDENFKLYKLMVSFQWAYIRCGTFVVTTEKGRVNPSAEGELWLAAYIKRFDKPALFADIYHGLETLRICSFLHHELPGLMRDVLPLFNTYSGIRATGDAGEDFFAALQGMILQHPDVAPAPWDVFDSLDTAHDSLAQAKNVYRQLQSSGGKHTAIEPLPFQGCMMLGTLATVLMKQRQERKTQFIDSLATLLLHLPESQSEKHENGQRDGTTDSKADAPLPDEGRAMVLPDSSTADKDNAFSQNNDPLYLTINNEEVELSDEMAELASEIVSDQGHIPDRYISSAAGKAGQGDPGEIHLAPPEGEAVSAPITYDEWDFRRSGFRRNWCIVTEKEIPVTRSTFISATLERYHGQIIRLRHQFEMMRTTERFVRRQRDGDDIDLDAMVESMADTLAGQPPSDRLFIRLKRDERDIAALFLVDMSNSTRGWVGQGIKESLVLISEAMETLGDRYGIYGFSGMRRLRCEIFPIKSLDEPYNDAVRERIGSIAPREYTRMAPAIRHMTSLLQDVDAKVRLLITLSDGKPEDYDDYKGDYAIEDTRHALIEAKMAGIHPFCITIDQHAHEYMAHMYGEVNYIIIDDVQKLPARMPEIYRVLTS